MTTYAVPRESLSQIADAIRAKTGNDAPMTVAGMVGQIESISGGGANVEIGEVTIDAATTTISVQYGLGRMPDFAAIYADVPDWDDMPAMCVMITYHRAMAVDIPNRDKDELVYMFGYKHPDTGSYILGTYQIKPTQYSDTQFNFLRGLRDWQPVDNNGNQIKYKYVIGCYD